MNVHHIHEFAYEQDEGNCFLVKIIVFDRNQQSV